MLPPTGIASRAFSTRSSGLPNPVALGRRGSSRDRRPPAGGCARPRRPPARAIRASRRARCRPRSTRAEHLVSGKSEELARHSAAAFGGAFNHLRAPNSLGVATGLGVQPQGGGVADHNGKKIVEIVSQPACQPHQRFHLLRLVGGVLRLVRSLTVRGVRCIGRRRGRSFSWLYIST